jgi:hypothetical protein
LNQTDKLEKKIREAQREEMNFRKYAEQYQRRLQEKDKYDDKTSRRLEFYRSKQRQKGLEVTELQGQLAALRLLEEKKAYRSKRDQFYKDVIEAVIGLKKELLKFREKKPAEIEDAGSYYAQVVQHSGVFEKEDMRLFHEYLPVGSIVGILARLAQERGREIDISLKRGPAIAAQAKQNIETWSNNLIGQLDSLADGLKKKLKESIQ